MPPTVDLHVQIVRFVLDHQPAIVACEIVDAGGSRHTFIDKVWMFLDRNLNADSPYPFARARLKAGLTQAQFAALFGVSQRTLEQWERPPHASGAAKTLIRVAVLHPEILREIAA